MSSLKCPAYSEWLGMANDCGWNVITIASKKNQDHVVIGDVEEMRGPLQDVIDGKFVSAGDLPKVMLFLHVICNVAL